MNTEVKYIKIHRGVGTYYGMVLPPTGENTVGTVLLYEEGCYMPAPIVIETTMQAILEIQAEKISGKEITEDEFIDFINEHSQLLGNRPLPSPKKAEEDIS